MNQALFNEPGRNIHIMVCGLVSTDIIFTLQDMPRHAEKYRADDVRLSLGGGGAIAIVTLQKLGISVHLAGRIGDDMFANSVRDELIARNIECSRITQIPDCKTPLSSIFVDAGGERQIVNYRRTDDNDQANLINLLGLKDIDASTGMDAVLVDTRWKKAALHILQYAHEQQIPAVVDAEAPVCHEAMALATHVAFSRQGLCDYADSDDLENGLRRASAQFNNWVCVTDGAKGVFYLDNNRIKHIPSFPITPIDTLVY